MAVIRTEHLTKTFRMGDIEVLAVRDLFLSVEKGDFVSIMGPSGSGKTSLMNILGCLDRPTSGKYYLDDSDVSTLSKDALATIRNKKIGFVFQNYNLLPRISVRENVILPLLYREESLTRREQLKRASDALEMVGLGERMHFSVKQLSGGQQQRVTIARALVNSPTLIFADEPTGALDTRVSFEIMGILQQLNEKTGITVVMVTHDPEMAQFSKRVIAFRDGMIMEDTRVAVRSNANEELRKIEEKEKK
ncbi:MAG: ABC transporter ATP-binding protein [Candidatus Eremiobacteraeota bacterium]|nr:ABC transporter ATP-binding protein [Candidatus Eremiobacteraeota bacterium]